MNTWEKFVRDETKAKGLRLYEIADALNYDRKYFYQAIKREPTPRLKEAVEAYLKGEESND